MSIEYRFERLIAAKADITIQDKDGRTALQLAANDRVREHILLSKTSQIQAGIQPFFTLR